VQTATNAGLRKKEALMKLLRSGLVAKFIIFALIVYACISLVTMRGRIEDQKAGLDDVRRAVAEKELTNAELEYEIENHNEPDVIAGIARSDLGLVLPGEVIYYDSGNSAP
jgi:cell division protein FtsB